MPRPSAPCGSGLIADLPWKAEEVMARIGGRSTWLAVPAGVLCAAVVGSLIWLALPMVPVSVAWVGDTLRTASAPRPVPSVKPTPAQLAAAGSEIDCRDLYPDALWGELTWQGGALLAQTASPSATAVTSLWDALAPTVLVTCAWRLEGGRGIVTTLATVPADAAAIADPALRGQGFTCTSTGAALSCVRVSGDVVEEHALRAGLWLSSIETGWHLDDYGARVEAKVWAAPTG
jgi:hypothetical protein